LAKSDPVGEERSTIVINGVNFSFCKNPLDIVGPDWYYSYDGYHS
jgi:hypothetical protein